LFGNYVFDDSLRDKRSRKIVGVPPANQKEPRQNARVPEMPAILKSRRDRRIAGVSPALCRKANKKAVTI
jgi:hypothetical protein